MALPTALQIHRSLPGTNCKKCGEHTCVAFALKLVEERDPGILDLCREITPEQKRGIIEMLAPAVSEVALKGDGETLRVGGEDVLYRHEYRFNNRTAIYMDISDSMSPEEIDRRIRFINDYVIERVGEVIGLDGISARCASGDGDRFRCLVETIAREYKGPLILASTDPGILEKGLTVIPERRPLLYAATKANYMEVLRIAEKYGSPVALSAENTDDLLGMASELSGRVNGIILDPGVDYCNLGRTVNDYALLRDRAISGERCAGHPLMASAVSLQNRVKCKEEPSLCTFDEAILSIILMSRYASLIIIHDIEPWAILPVITFRKALYADPRLEPSIKPGLYKVGSPDEGSPVILTTNFTLTYYSVSHDLEAEDISSHILVVDTGGLAVTVSVAAEKLTASKVKEALDSYAKELPQRQLIIPGVAARLKPAIEEATGWDVLVGPQDSSRLPEYIGKLGVQGKN